MQQVGVVGMAVMGKNLALNIESRGYTVSIFNRTSARTDLVLEEHPDKNLVGTYSIEEFVASLEKPRKIILMVQAGPATDMTIASLLPHLDKGDILIDGGNTFFKDTIRRYEELKDSDIHFIGTGVSGGEEGALKGPAIMPGGPKEAYDLVEDLLVAISAKAKDGEPCVAYMGPNGAGHFVKMVHNGIEYGDMQLIAEAYALMRHVLGLSTQEVGRVFEEWNKGRLESYLMEISAHVLQTMDPDTGEPLVEKILDAAGNKGTGKWTSQNALDLGEPVSLITEAVFARYISAFKDERVHASTLLKGVEEVSLTEAEKEVFIDELERALYFSKIISYAQGFAQLKEASRVYHWDLQLGEIAKVFRAGCIIRAAFLEDITNAYRKNPELDNLMLDDFFMDTLNSTHQSLRQMVMAGVRFGVPIPAFSAAISYYDSYRAPVLSANVIQGQRDFFGAHTYQRVDKEGIFHFDWQEGVEYRLD
ncbi:phosphogluconate dehydrogenase (NADP(+)-dependent, decarboxylating) [Dolosicoccus paucivorans]|uniref:6-phosphogluconate dehydrogenase, decarboxylating n=1 Tax=Dolosicoccus paucivorans TaxID=84521 RepID=A0A2N6SPL3_9LACT|nr:NADP-dependent phosphogluconate dehydrogenase [Dolosicoccus paucivorans]PMB85037.1 phosphogluconate dehydrogenase (NADP(+)-dependent, decarboxylating) [Dolosicoccus paucivorans]PMC59008.1 phosphogluconate dehydrogenase (NADP(+)-dependent, decarboxylating) [Dolosicoccus paucivorans]